MKLKHITFTGLDARTNVEDLVAIQKKCPVVEFGVLMSKNWDHNGNRYPNPELVKNFLDRGLNLSAHLCGYLAREAYKGHFEPVIDIYPMFAHKDFKRVQLNVSPYEDIYMSAGQVHSGIDKEIIIQQKSPTMMYSKAFDKFLELNPELNVTMLVDPSGGRGISEGLDIIATDHKTGYAGGLNESNVYDKLYVILSLETVGDVWIDMESGVRTDDWFNTDKVMRVLERCDKVIKDMRL